MHVLRGRELQIAADRPFTLYADGDPIGELPLRVSVLPAAVRVLVPADSPLGQPAPAGGTSQEDVGTGSAAGPASSGP